MCDRLPSVRALTMGAIDDTPSMTASRIDLIHRDALQHGLRENQRERQFGCRAGLADDAEHDATFVGELHARDTLESTAVEDADLASRLDAQHTHQMRRFIVSSAMRLVCGRQRGA